MLKDYYYLTKPGIVYGNLLSVIAGYLLATANRPIDLVLFASVSIGTSLVIASACAVNNYIDRGIDSKMARTKRRAVAAQRITGTQALVYAAVLGGLGFSLLWFATNRLTFMIGVIAWIDYVWLYGWSKRRSYHGTLVGTIAGSAPLVAGYTAATGRLDLAALLLFIIMFTWQMAHFYAIALYRAKDYRAAGIPVISVIKGPAITKRWIMRYIAGFSVACLSLSIGGYTGYCFAGGMLLTGGYWFWCGLRPAVDDAHWGRQMLGISLLVLLVLSLLLSVGGRLP